MNTRTNENKTAKFFSNKKSVLIFTVLAFIISLLSINLAAQNPNTLIKGKIIDNVFKTPICFDYVTIEDSSKLITTISDEDGTFGLFDISEGYHYIQISKQGYEDTVMLVNVSADKKKVPFIALNYKIKPDLTGSSINNNYINIDKNPVIYNAPDFLFNILNFILYSF
jgi:hypothetical protein